MKQRCHNPKNHSYKNYGGRGIGLCDRWLRSVAAFLEDMGPRPSPHHTVERLDNDGPYAPDNCVWAIRQVQNRNQRKTVRLTIHGRTASVPDWADISGIPAHAIRARLSRGWEPEVAVFPQLEPKYQHSPYPKAP